MILNYTHSALDNDNSIFYYIDILQTSKQTSPIAISNFMPHFLSNTTVAESKKSKLKFQAINLNFQVINLNFQAQKVKFQANYLNFQAQKVNFQANYLNFQTQKVKFQANYLNFQAQKLKPKTKNPISQKK